MTDINDPIVAKVIQDLISRSQRGFEKYGLTVSDNPLPVQDWLQHAYEEALDMAVYLKRAMRDIRPYVPPRFDAQD